MAVPDQRRLNFVRTPTEIRIHLKWIYPIWKHATIRVFGTIDGYVKVGNPLDGNPFVHCPEFDFQVSGAELMDKGRVRMELGGADIFVAIERISDSAMCRDVSGTFEIEPENGPHGFRPVYLAGYSGGRCNSMDIGYVHQVFLILFAATHP